MFLVIYAFIMMLSWLDDIRFNVILIMMISMWWMMLVDYSFIFYTSTSMLDFNYLHCSMFSNDVPITTAPMI